MKRSLARLLRGRKTVYMSAIIGFSSMILGLALFFRNEGLTVAIFSFFIVATVFIGISWFSHVLYVRSQLQVIQKNTSSTASRSSRFDLEVKQLSRKFAQVEASLEEKFDIHANQQMNEYRTQAFNTLLSIQDFKDSTLEEPEPYHEP